ncbi:MAG: ATP-binding cassette domain-containing protein [Pseudomonadota bacterium]
MTAPASPALDLALGHVTISVHGRSLVRDLSARIEPGGVLAVMGPSGSGKSSLLAWVAGTLEPPFEASGGLRLGGEELSLQPIQRRRIGLLFQDDLLFPHLSVLGNLLFALPAGRRMERIEAAEAALAEAGLGGFGTRLPGSLSGGQRSRVSLLRALLAAPVALLLDEPFSKLDITLREQMRQFTFSSLAARKVPALLVTHDTADVPADATVIHLDHA